MIEKSLWTDSEWSSEEGEEQEKQEKEEITMKMMRNALGPAFNGSMTLKKRNNKANSN